MRTIAERLAAVRTRITQAAAAAGKQGVTHEQQVLLRGSIGRVKIGDMTCGVPGYIQYLKIGVEGIDVNDVSVGQALADVRNGFLRRAVYRQRIVGQQVINAANVVPMVMGDKNGHWLQRLRLQGRDDRLQQQAQGGPTHYVRTPVEDLADTQAEQDKTRYEKQTVDPQQGVAVEAKKLDERRDQ